MKTKTLLVTAEIPVTVYVHGDDAEVEKASDPAKWTESLNSDDWRDGRYSFAQKMIDAGLEQEFESAVGNAVRQAFQAEHGDKVIHKDGSTWAMWVVRTQEWWKEVWGRLMIHRDRMKITVCRVDDIP